MIQWTLERNELPLKFLWKIARGSIETKESYFVRLTDGTAVTRGEVSPNTRYQNTPEVIRADFERFVAAAKKEKKLGSMDLSEFERWLDGVSLCNTLRFGVESAWIHYQSLRLGREVAAFLGLPEITQVETSFSVPIMPVGQLEEFIRPLSRFKSLKIKVDAECAVETIHAVSHLTSQKLRIDGNEAWRDPDDLMRFVQTLRGCNVEFIEQPMPAHMKDAYREVLPRFPYPLIADESIEDVADFDELKKQFSGVNIKLMKTGGCVRAIGLLRSAREHGMKTMLGCMVETSLGISTAMHLCSLVDYPDLDGFLLLKEDPFQLIEENNGTLTFAR